MDNLPSGSTTTTYKRSAYINYFPTDGTQPTPSPPTTRVDTSSTYYFIYNISDWVDMINECFRGLTAQIKTDMSNTLAFNQPYVSYDLSCGLFSINRDNTLDYGVSGKLIDFKTFFNPRLYNILPFPSILASSSADGAFNTTYLINLSS